MKSIELFILEIFSGEDFAKSGPERPERLERLERQERPEMPEREWKNGKTENLFFSVNIPI